jgi:dipeptidyl aminopeptidase/acylaminoacyl peptidase
MMRYAATLLGLALLAAPAAAAPTATGLSPGPLAAPDSIVAQGVPELPRPDPALLRPYENIRTANLQDWHPTERRLVIRTRFAETTQLHEVAMPLGDRTQITFFEDRVTSGSYRPGNPDQVLFVVDEGGAENFQLHLLDRRTGRSRLVSDGKNRYTGALWAKDGRLLAYTSNARNGRDSDIYVADPAKPGSERRLAEVEGSWTPLDWSRDGRRLLVSEFLSANESYLHWVDVESGKVHAITPRPDKGGATVIYGGGQWAPDGRAVYTSSDRGGEFRQLVRLDLSEKAEGGRPAETVLADIPWDVETADLSDDGSLIAFFVNADGVSRLHLLDLKTGQELPSPDLPEGVAAELRFRPGHRELAFDLEWARSPNDVYTYDPDARRLERWTRSEIGGLDPETFPIPELVRYPTFDETAAGVRRTIPALVYRPDPGRFPGKRPVFINIHGGPEGQERPDFLGSNNFFVTEMGVVYVVPNVRGSSGYGKTYLKLDNSDKREDSVKDIGALLDWIAAQPNLDAQRVMVGGGSYGGYMVLASLVHYSDRLRAGFDSVGISNFVTFLENTQDYRRDLRRVEYGDERDPRMRAHLETISPARNAQRIRKPLLVAQGANDPRVPLSESDQIVAAVRGNQVPVWYVVAKDEGHGFRKKTNTDYLRMVLFEFMRRHLLGETTAAVN